MTRRRVITALVTRPGEKNQSLCAALNLHHINTIALPTLLIEPVINEPIKNRLSALKQFHLIIFTSGNAVQHSQAFWPIFSSQQQIFAIGPATAAELFSKGLKPIFSVEHAFNSESLLALKPLQDVNGKKIAIIGGKGGRTLLADTLTQRGALVEKIEVYQRLLPTINLSHEIKRWQQIKLNLIVTTSNEGLTNLLRLIPQAFHSWLFARDILVVSQRGASLAHELGFNQSIIVTDGASNQAILQAIISWYNV